MGVEFLQKTDAEQAKVAEFLEALRGESSRAPQILVEPEEIDLSPGLLTDPAKLESDPLLALFLRGDSFSPEEFLNELSTQRGGIPESVNLAVQSVQPSAIR